MNTTPHDALDADAPSADPGNRRTGPLTRDELDRGLRLSDVPPVLTAKEAARLMRLSETALYRRVARGEFRSAINGRGKPLRFWRDRFVKEFFAPRHRHGASGGGNAG